MILGSKYYSGKKAVDGDVLEILDEGKWVESKFKRPDGTFKNSFQMTVQVNGEKYSFNVNKKNSDTMIAAWGNDTLLWIGKKANVHLKEVEVAGEDVIAIRLVPTDLAEEPVEGWPEEK
jgi:hypothetical protein